LRRTPRFTLVTEISTLPPLAERQDADQNAFRRAAIDRVSPAYGPRLLPWVGSVARSTHRSHLEAARRYVSTSLECSLASVSPPTRLAAHRTSRRAMRRTNYLPSHSSYPYPRIVGSRRVERLRACTALESTASRQCDSLQQECKSPDWAREPRWAFSSHAVFVNLPLTPLSRLPPLLERSRVHEAAKSAKVASNPPA